MSESSCIVVYGAACSLHMKQTRSLGQDREVDGLSIQTSLVTFNEVKHTSEWQQDSPESKCLGKFTSACLKGKWNSA